MTGHDYIYGCDILGATAGEENKVPVPAWQKVGLVAALVLALAAFVKYGTSG